MKPDQAYYFIYYRVFGYKRVKTVQGIGWSKYISELLTFRLNRAYLKEDTKTVTFLNHTVEYSQNQYPWHKSDVSRLWAYNLHYFHYLRQSDISIELKESVIQNWIDQNPQMTRPGWEPYTTSLRIVNWVIYFASNSAKESWNNSLFEQTRWLFSNLEKHILANHYFENLKALIFSSFYFSKSSKPFVREANAWKGFAFEKLEQQLKEQFLPDGGHFERSPQYHLQMVVNCLEILSLLKHSCHKDNNLVALLTEVVLKGLSLSCMIARPDHKIPLFNDSSLDETPNLIEVLAFANELEVGLNLLNNDYTLIEASEFGVFGYKTKSNWIAIDCGDIGPSYQPGHTHCDLLSFELMIKDRMIVVDGGVFEYDNTSIRHFQRSTKAHNTVSVNGQDQSEVWGSFRVGKRAIKQFAEISLTNNKVYFDGAYKGFQEGKRHFLHRRKVELDLDANTKEILKVRVMDSVKPSTDLGADILIESFINLHPLISVQPVNSNEYTLYVSEQEIGRFCTDADATLELGSSSYSPEFGLLEKTNLLSLKTYGKSIHYEFSFN